MTHHHNDTIQMIAIMLVASLNVDECLGRQVIDWTVFERHVRGDIDDRLDARFHGLCF
jgi:hypothetical protein